MDTILVNPPKSKPRKPTMAPAPRRKSRPRKNPTGVEISEALWALGGAVAVRAGMRAVDDELDAGGLKTMHWAVAAAALFFGDDVAKAVGARGADATSLKAGLVAGLAPYLVQAVAPEAGADYLLPVPSGRRAAGTGEVDRGARYRSLAGVGSASGAWVTGADGRLYWYPTMPPSVAGVSSSASTVDLPDDARVGDVVRTPDGRRFEVVRSAASGRLAVAPLSQGTGSVPDEGRMTGRYFRAS